MDVLVFSLIACAVLHAVGISLVLAWHFRSSPLLLSREGADALADVLDHAAWVGSPGVLAGWTGANYE